MPVVSWICPSCGKIVGVRNVGSARPACSKCEARHLPQRKRPIAQLIADIWMRLCQRK